MRSERQTQMAGSFLGASVKASPRVAGAARAILEWTVVLVATPFLIFPSVYPWLTVGVLVLVGTAVVVFTVFDQQGAGLWELAGPLRLPWAILAAWMIIGSFVSPSPDLTLPKLSGMVLGMLVLRVVLLSGTTSGRIRVLTWAYLLAGTCTVLGGLLAGPRWLRKFETLYFLNGMIPRVVLGLPGAEGGVNPNALGGTTLLFLPLLAVLILHGLRVTAMGRTTERHLHRRAVILEASACTTAAVIPLMVLVLSQTRTAWIGLPIVGLLVLAIRFRMTLLLCALGATTGLIGWNWFGPWSLSKILGPERPFVWSLAVNAIQAHPTAGVGLGGFRVIAGPALEAGITEPTFFAHAHNVFLQVALDVGIPGLVAYLALLGLATYMTQQVLRRDCDSHEKAVCVGLWGNLVAIHIFGLADAIALGTKVGVYVWWNLGLIAALHNSARPRWEGSGYVYDSTQA